MRSILKHPSAWIPIALSLAMLAFIISVLTLHGIPTPDPNADEGVGAHLFQLWLMVEAVMVTFFIVKWIPQKPLQASFVLVIQIAAVITACFPVFYFHL